MSNEPHKINMTNTYQTRDGRKVRVLCIDRKGVDYPVVALVEKEGGRDAVLAFYPDGKCFVCKESPHDLIPVPKFNVGDIWLCRDGETKVEILKTDMRGEWPIAGVITQQYGTQIVSMWRNYGVYMKEADHLLDLITKL